MRFTAALVALPLIGSAVAAPIAEQEEKRLFGGGSGLLGGLGNLLGGGNNAGLPSVALPSLALPTGGLLPGLLGPSGIIDGTVSLCPVLGQGGVVVNLNGKPLLQPCTSGTQPTPTVSLPAVSLPAVSIPAVSIPAISVPLISVSVGLDAGAGVNVGGGSIGTGALAALPTGQILPPIISAVNSIVKPLPTPIPSVVSAVGGAVQSLGAGLGL